MTSMLNHTPLPLLTVQRIPSNGRPARFFLFSTAKPAAHMVVSTKVPAECPWAHPSCQERHQPTSICAEHGGERSHGQHSVRVDKMHEHLFALETACVQVSRDYMYYYHLDDVKPPRVRIDHWVIAPADTAYGIAGVGREEEFILAMNRAIGAIDEVYMHAAPGGGGGRGGMGSTRAVIDLIKRGLMRKGPVKRGVRRRGMPLACSPAGCHRSGRSTVSPLDRVAAAARMADQAEIGTC